MAVIYRILRFFSSSCVPISVVVSFTCILTFVFVLYQPNNTGPGRAQRLGWQAWDTIGQKAISPIHNAATNSSGTVSNDVDWWDTKPGSDTQAAASLPLDVWAPLLAHSTGISELAVTRCILQPSLTVDTCTPPSSAEEDAKKGKWVRVNRNLNLQAKWSYHLTLYYRRTRRLNISLITDLKLLSSGSKPEGEDWHKVTLSIRDGVRGTPALFLWYHTPKTGHQLLSEEHKDKLITELDVLYGADVPWYGFERVEPAVAEEVEGKIEGTWLTFRRGVKAPPRAPPLHFSREGRFKVMQIADLHFSVARGDCRDTIFSPCTHSDNLTSTLLGKTLDAEKPDLVVFTGDQLNGQGTSYDPKSVLAKFAKAVTARGIPWTAVFGNHDEETGPTSKAAQVQLMQALPYSLIEAGPADIHGVGNYVLKVNSADASKTHLLTLYFLDSGSYTQNFWDWFQFKAPEYDWIKQSQIDWFLQESSSINQIERPFTPDSTKDLGNIWNRQQVNTGSKRLAKPNALMFFHMPLPETYAKADLDIHTKKPLDKGISGQETNGNAKGSDGFFEKGVLRAYESDHVAAGGVHEVKAIGNGHCHLTENCRRVKGVWFCFGGGGSYSGYGKPGFDRRFRIYDVSNYGEDIRTYKRTEHDEIVDEMVLAGRGAPSL